MFYIEALFVGFHLGGVSSDLRSDVGSSAVGKAITKYAPNYKVAITAMALLCARGISINGGDFAEYKTEIYEPFWIADGIRPPNYDYWGTINQDDYYDVLHGL